MELNRRTLITGAAVTAAVGGLEVAAASGAAAALPTLKYGSSGTAVVTLQKKLSALGYWCGAADGRFGPLCQQAVYALQKAAGIGRDGVVGPMTWSKLYAGVRPAKRATSGTVIEINKARQLLLVVVSGRLTTILNTSTGSGKLYWSSSARRYVTATTPTGTFSIFRRYTTGWQTGPLGSMYRPTYWYGGYAIHGSTSIPPYPASHGCCRVSTAGMDLLYTRGHVPIGRRVQVY